MLRDESVSVEVSWCGGDEEDGHAARCARLHRRLRRIVKARGALDMQEAEALREAERLRLWRHYGYSSLLEYIEMELGHSPRAALERLRVANAIVELPAIAGAMTQGDLSFSAARELTRVATPETEQVWLEAANDKNLRELEALVSGHKRGDKPDDPVDPKMRKRKLRYDEIDEETVALVRQAREILERECGERLDDDAFLRTLARMVVDGASSPPRTKAPYQIAVSTCAQCKRGWQDGGGITVEMSPAALATAHCAAQHIGPIEAAPIPARRKTQDANAIPVDISPTTHCDAQHIGSVEFDAAPIAAGRKMQDADAISVEMAPTAHCDARHIGSVESEAAPIPARRQGQAGSKRTRARSSIPPALRRKVNARDHGRCRVPWCRSSRNIDQHHLTPVSEGGEHTLDNLITLCESHHIALHEGALLIEGDAANARFTRRAHSSFAIAQHAVETAAALRTLGFDRSEVRAAVEQTRTHVGASALTLEDWIRIALSYCPKPRA